MYTAIVLDAASVETLSSFARDQHFEEKSGLVFRTDQGQPLPHHMTVNLGRLDEELNPGLAIGIRCELSVTGFWHDPTLGLLCAYVSYAVTEDGVPVRSKNLYPHITTMLRPGSKPAWSNKSLETPGPAGQYVMFEKLCVLTGTVEECQ